MQFRVTDGRYEAVLASGDVVKFESLDELREVCHQRVEIMRLLRNKNDVRSRRRFVACKATGTVAKKKVRINILPDEDLKKEKDSTREPGSEV